MKRRACLLPSLLLIFLMATRLGLAQTTYEDPQGRFVVDLPQGWKYAPMVPALKNDLVSDFQGEGKTITMAYNPGIDDLAKLMKHVQTQFNFLKAVFEGDVQEMTLNGHPARRGVLKTPLDPELVILCGAVDLGESGLYFFSVIQSKDVAIKERIEKSLLSIRLPGETVTGVEDAKAVSPPIPPATSSTPWKSDLVSLTLPSGWTEKPRPRGFEKEVKGWFMNDNLPGASMMVVCYKGFGMNMAKALDAGIKSMTIPNPSLKPVEAQEMKLANGKINFVALRGMVAAGGQEIELVSVITVSKADKCYVNLILTGVSSLLPELKRQALEITETVK